MFASRLASDETWRGIIWASAVLHACFVSISAIRIKGHMCKALESADGEKEFQSSARQEETAKKEDIARLITSAGACFLLFREWAIIAIRRQ